MKRLHWLTLLGVSGAGLSALLLGQSVLGQPEAKAPLLPLPPGVVIQVENAGGPKAAPELPQFPPATPSSPLFPDAPSSPPALPRTPSAPLISAAPLTIEVAPAAPQKLVPMPVSFDVQPGKQQPALSIEWVAPASIRINQPMACQIVVRNTSTTPAQNVVVRHRPTQGVVCKASEPNALNDGGELHWSLGTMAPEQTRRIDLTLVAQTRGPIDYHATISFAAVAAHQVQVREPMLAVKMSGPDKVIAGENVTLLFAISNPGDGIAEGIKLKTMLPDGLEHPRGKVVDFEVGNLAPKESKVVQLICQAKGNGLQKCTITVNGDGGLAASDSAQVDVLMPKLDVAMSGPKLRYLDRHAVYVLKVSNPGSAPASNVEVQKSIPIGFKFHQANHGGQYLEATRLVSWNLGELQPGESKDIAVDLIPVEPGEHRLVAQAKAARGLKSEADARTIVEGLPSLFIEVGHIDDPLEVGAETAYEIRLMNAGTKVETNLEVVCTLPDQLEFKGAKCSTTLRYRQEGRELIFEPLPRLAPKADVIYRVQVKGIAPGDVRFRTKIKSDGLKEPVLREESTRVYSDEGPVKSAPLAPTPVPSPRSTSVPIAPLPTPAPSTSTPAPAPIALPITSTPLPKTLPIPAPSTSIPAPAASALPIPAPSASKSIPAPSPLPIPAPSPLPGMGVPLPTPAPTQGASAAPIPPPLTPNTTSTPIPLPTPPMLPTPSTLPVVPGKS